MINIQKEGTKKEKSKKKREEAGNLQKNLELSADGRCIQHKENTK